MSLNSMRESFHHSAKWILGVVTVAMLFTAYTGIGSILGQRGGARQNAPAQQQSADTPIATVNGEPITRQEYDMAYNVVKQQAQAYNPGPVSVLMAGQMRAVTLERLIAQAEETQVAQKAGVTASSSEIEASRQAQLAGLKSSLGLQPSASEDDLNAALQKYTGQTVQQMLPDDVLRKQVLAQKYQDQIKRSSVASDAAIQDYFRKVHTRHILISNKTHPDAQAKDQAQQLIAKINGGADFAALAKQYSDDPGSKNKGGEDGWITEQTGYVPEFLKAAFALKPGQVTPQPILSPAYGYFIIQSLEAQTALPADYQKNKAKYQQQVSQFLQDQTARSVFSNASQTAKVVVNDPLLHAYWTVSQPPAAGQNMQTLEASMISDFNKALPTANYMEKAEIYANLAQIYAQQKKPKDEIAALNSALASSEDPQLRMMLGDTYRKTGDVKDALDQYKRASNLAYRDPSVHAQLQKTYAAMKQDALAADEAAWMKSYSQRQASAAQNVPLTAAPTASATAKATPTPKK